LKGLAKMHWKLSATVLPPLVVAAVLMVPSAASAQASFEPGDRVECDWLQNGTFDSGVVVPFTSTDLDTTGRWFRVKLDKDRIPNSTVECMATKLRAGTTRAVQARPAAVAAKPAQANPAARSTLAPAGARQVAAPAAKGAAAARGSLPPLPGTAWKIDYGRGKTGDVFLFCSTGTWEIVPAYGSIGAVGRSWRVSGATLTTVNRDDGQVQTWRMAGSDGVLVINDGRQVLRLHYNGTTQCR